MNAIEIKKCDAKIILYEKQQNEENTSDGTNEHSGVQDTIDQLEHNKQILNESTKQNLITRQEMKKKFFENYQRIKEIRASISEKIENQDIWDYLELFIKNNFLES